MYHLSLKLMEIQGQSLNIKSEKLFKVVRRFQQDSDQSRKEWTSRMVVSDCELQDRPNTMSKRKYAQSKP